MKKETRINLPLRARKAATKMDPFFDVNMLKYVREDGVFDGQMAIVNSLTHKTLGQVAKGYQLVTHREASKMVTDFLDQASIPYVSNGGEVGTAGSRFFEIITFPDFTFTPNGNSTAFDLQSMTAHERTTGEIMVPYIKIKNSYDKTSKVAWDYGIARILCSNGMSIITKEDSILSYRHNQQMDFEAAKSALFTSLQANIDMVQLAFNRLNSELGLDHLRKLIDGDLPDKFKIAVLEKVAPHAIITSKEVESKDGKRKMLIIEDIKTDASAWAIYNVATDVATHVLTSPNDKNTIGRKIAKQFDMVV